MISLNHTGKLSLNSQWVGRGAGPAPGPLLAWRVPSCKLESGVLWVGQLSWPPGTALGLGSAWAWQDCGMQAGIQPLTSLGQGLCAERRPHSCYAAALSSPVDPIKLEPQP